MSLCTYIFHACTLRHKLPIQKESMTMCCSVLIDGSSNIILSLSLHCGDPCTLPHQSIISESTNPSCGMKQRKQTGICPGYTTMTRLATMDPGTMALGDWGPTGVATRISRIYCSDSCARFLACMMANSVGDIFEIASKRVGVTEIMRRRLRCSPGSCW